MERGGEAEGKRERGIDTDGGCAEEILGRASADCAAWVPWSA